MFNESQVVGKEYRSRKLHSWRNRLAPLSLTSKQYSNLCSKSWLCVVNNMNILHISPLARIPIEDCTHSLFKSCSQCAFMPEQHKQYCPAWLTRNRGFHARFKSSPAVNGWRIQHCCAAVRFSWTVRFSIVSWTIQLLVLWGGIEWLPSLLMIVCALNLQFHIVTALCPTRDTCDPLLTHLWPTCDSLG